MTFIIPDISRSPVCDYKQDKTKCKNNTRNIMDRNSIIKPDHRVIPIGVLHTQTGYNKYQKHQCIDTVPNSYPYRI